MFPLFLCIVYCRRLSYLFLLFFRTLHSDAYIFPFLLAYRLLFFSQLFGSLPQTAILLFLHFSLTTSLKAYLQFGPSQWTSEDLFSWSLCLLPCFVAGYFFFLRLYLAHYSAYLPRLSIHRGPYLADLVLLDNQIQSHLRTHFYQCDL